MRVLFTTQAGSGHWRPLVPIARALEAAGHEVAFATTPIAGEHIAEYGFTCFAAGIDDWVEERQNPTEARPRQEGPAQAASVWADVFVERRAARSVPDLLTICRDWRSDVIVREMTEFGGCVAAECLGVPHAAVQVSAFRLELHRLIAPSIDRLRATHGLPADPELAMLYRYLLVSPIPASYQDPSQPLPPTTHAIRHVSFDVGPIGDEQLPPWVDELPDRPVVYATLGTTYNRDPDIFRAILDGLCEEPITLILTVGGDQDPAVFGDQPPHIRVERYIPQSLLFPHCDLAIIHGGFGTVLTAIEHGLPMIFIPIAADQPDNARRCADLGLAEVIAPDQRTPETIRAVTRTVLGEPRYRRNAERLRDEMQALSGPEYAVELLERLVAEKRPLAANVAWLH